MRDHTPHWLALVFLISSLALASCGSDDSDKPDVSKAEKDEQKIAELKKPKVKAPTPICPQTAVVQGLDLLRDYGNENPAPEQLVAAAKLLGITGTCEYKEDGVDVTFNANMAMKRGPRLGGTHASFPIFVAVLNPAGDVLNKDQITVEVTLPSNEATANHAEALHVFIPLAKDQQQLGPNYKILTGFQLTPAQAEQAKAKLKP